MRNLPAEEKADDVPGDFSPRSRKESSCGERGGGTCVRAGQEMFLCSEAVHGVVLLWRRNFRTARSWAIDEQIVGDESFDGAVGVAKDEESEQQADHSVVVAAEPVEVALSLILADEENEGGGAVERRGGKQIENAEKKIEGKEGVKDSPGKIT